MQPHSPLDSAVLPEEIDTNAEDSSDGKPGDESGHKYVTLLHCHTHSTLCSKHDCIFTFYVHLCTYAYTRLSQTHTLLVPPKKKQRREKKSKAEKTIESAMNLFIKYQTEAEKRDEERWKKEMELEEKRRKEDQQHELRVMQMLGQMLQHRSYPPTNPSPYEFNYHDDTF